MTTVRDAWRGLRVGRAATLLAFAIMTMTMTAATVTYSIVDAIAIEPLPYGSPERLVGIQLPSTVPGRGMPASPKDFFDWLEGTRSFDGMAAVRTTALDLETGGVTRTLAARRVTASLFDVLQIRPAAGQFFTPAYDKPGGPDGVVISHPLWQRQFAGDPSIVGRQLRLGGSLRPVTGVMPEGVWYPITTAAPPDVYVPYVVTAAERENDRCCVFVVARMRPGVTFEQARADVERMSSALVLRLHDQVAGPAKTSMLLVLAAVGFVLLVACVNVANLLLARATTRLRDFATRLALGASRGRLAAGLLVEGLMLSITAAAAAVVLSFLTLELARSVLPPGLARTAGIAIDARVLSASAVASLLCGLLFATAPAWHTMRSDLVSAMKAGGGPVIGSREEARSLRAFLVANVSFVCVLLVATALVVETFRILTTKDLGFDRENVMSIWFQRSLDGVDPGDRPAAVASFRADLIERARSVPGVTHAAISTTGAPLSGTRSGVGLEIPGYGRTSGFDVYFHAVTPEYFAVMGMQLVRGRLLNASDVAGTPDVMVISDVAARRFFGDRDPVGQTIAYQFSTTGPVTVVGVVRGVNSDGPESDPRPEVYAALDQRRYRDLAGSARTEVITVGGLFVRTSRDPRALSGAVREAIKPALLGREPQATQYVDEYFSRLTAVRRFNATLMAVFGIIAAAIGAVGVYGTMAFLVARQVRTIGIRIALGASQQRILWSVLADALRRVLLGTAIGLLGAWLVSGTFASFVFGVRPAEPAVYLAVAGFLSIIGIAAALAPALRAASVDPVKALRLE